MKDFLVRELNALKNYEYKQVEKDFLNGGRHCGKQKQRRNNEKKDVSEVSQQKIDGNSIVCDIMKARKNIQLSLASDGSFKDCQKCSALSDRVASLEVKIADLENSFKKFLSIVDGLQGGKSATATKNVPEKAPKLAPKDDDDDDDIDLFGSDEDEEASELHKKRVAEYAAKKSKKPAAVAKSSVVLDIKPWDDETDMDEMQRLVRSFEMDGLVWGASKLVPLAYGIKKLQIVCVIEDEKVSVEELSEKLQEFEDHVQSVDVAAFNKI